MAAHARRVRVSVVVGFLAYIALAAASWWSMLQVAPTHVAFTVLGKTLDVGSLHDHINNTFLIFLLLPTALWIEAMVVGWSNSSARQMLFSPTASLKTDIALFVLGQAHLIDIVGRLMVLGLTMVSGAWLHAWIQTHTGINLGPPPMPFALQIPFYFLVATFFDYWTHRLDHTRFFWPLHRYHHSATDFGVITTARQHPAMFTAIIVINMPMAVLGAPADVMLYVNVLVVALGFIIHSKIEADWGWMGRWVIQSPTHHRLHHKLDMTHPTGHFSSAPIWDHLFGTWYGDKPDPKLVIGVDTPYRHGVFVVRDILRDYYHFWIGWFGGRSDGPESDIVLGRKA